MTSIKFEPTKILVLYPCTRGFSYAVMESPLDIIDVNTISPKKYNQKKLLKFIKYIIDKHAPLTIVLEDYDSKYSRKGVRARQLQNKIVKWAAKKEIPIEKYSRNTIRNVFKRWHAKTKYDIVQVLLKNIESLKPFAYPFRKYPQREHNHASVFSAVSLGVTHYFVSDVNNSV